jgi:hypothetical protein
MSAGARWKILCAAPVSLAIILVIGGGEKALPQARRNIKVVLETKQSEAVNRAGVQGSGSVVIRKGSTYPSGRVAGGAQQTAVQRSSGIFTLVADGGESILTVAIRVPQSEIAYYHNYALGIGAVERRVVFNDVGTSLRVRAATLPDGQIQLRLTPRISYFSAERPGAIEFTEAATELVVPDGQTVSLGGSTTNLHEITRQILGYRNRQSSGETSLAVTATLQ